MLGLGLGLGFGMSRRPSISSVTNGGPELLLQAEVLQRTGSGDSGEIIRSVAVPWIELVDHLGRDSNFLMSFANHPRVRTQ